MHILLRPQIRLNHKKIMRTILGFLIILPMALGVVGNDTIKAISSLDDSIIQLEVRTDDSGVQSDNHQNSDTGQIMNEYKCYYRLKGFLRNWSVTILTFGLLIVATAQFFSLKKANETAKRALEATKRSVDAYIGREKGRLVIEECHRPEPDASIIKFYYVNAGPSELTITGFGAISVIYVINGKFEIPEIPVTAATQVVKSGERFAGDVWNGQFMFGIPGSIRIPPEMTKRLADDSNTRLLVAFRFIYNTAFGHYIKQQVFVMEPYQALDIGDRDLCFDIPYQDLQQKKNQW